MLGGEHIVGRGAELAAIANALATRRRVRRAVVLEGDAGIGKTTLWRAGLEHARASASRVLTCRPAQAETALPFSALADLLEPVLDSALPSLPVPQRVALEVALQRAEPPDDPTDRFAVARGVLGILRDPGAGETLIAVDDVQWLDASSEDALAYALRRTDDAPVTLLLARRGAPGAPLPLGLDGASVVDRLHVGPLTVDELGRLLLERLEVEPARPQLVRLHDASGGNPYFALEIARAYADRGQSMESAGTLDVPDSVGALLRERIGELSPTARDATLLASACAAPSAAVIERVTGSRAAVTEALEQGILERDGDRLGFSHPLLATVAYGATDPRTRREAHRRLADAFADPDDRALHLGLATEYADDEVASELDFAASRANRRGAPAVAARLADEAIRLTPADRLDERLVRATRAAEYHLAAGATARGRVLLEQAVDLHDPGPGRARLLLRLGRVRYVSDDVEAARELFERAREEAGDDAALRAAAEQALAFLGVVAGDIPGALARAATALELAEEVDDPGLRGLALGRLASTAFLAGEGLDRARLDEAVRLEDAASDMPMEWRPSFVYAGCAMWADDLETARALYERLHGLAIERGDERAMSQLLFSMSQLECAAGNWQRAARFADVAVERSRRSGLATLQTIALSAQALVCALMGRVDEARAVSGEGMRIAMEAGVAPAIHWHLSALGFLELSLDDPVAAHQHLGPLAQAIVGVGLAEPGVVRFLPDAIESLVALGEFEAAEEPLGLLEERGRALQRVWALATAGRCRALLQAAQGDVDAARETVADAVAEHHRLGQPFELGRTLLAQGSIERRAKARAAARETLTRALDIFDSLGAPLWAERTAAELARIPGRARASSELTETESRVAALVAEGLSNKEVAARLFVSVRAVEANLSKVYAKLGVRSRTELAGRLTRAPDS